ncbi:MAG: DNA recombination protein RmuC [Coriobacteriia bacterium]|nr:DNA recombination protein RmuC [Coriobacteriia bacterium]
MFLAIQFISFTPQSLPFISALLLFIIAMIVVVWLQANSFRRIANLDKRLDENNKQIDQVQQAVQFVGTQTNERIAEQTRAINERLTDQSKLTLDNQSRQTESLNTELGRNRDEMSKEFKQVRETMEARLTSIQQVNTQKLDEMRAVVDEKLSETLEKRFSESFTLISERLESVQRGLGEMQILAGNVTDLKNILANVKTRGNFGEYQLQALLEDVFTPDQYEINFAPNPRSQHRVEFAIRLPGAEDEPVYLPIDSKFPIEDYQRLLDAYDNADKDTVNNLYKSLINSTRSFARDIRDKYIKPPRTTDFGIMFVPTEGLYAELMREPGFADNLRREFKVLPAGPSTLQALIVSFQVGFSTLAIEKRSSEIEKILGAVKTEFEKFEGILENVDKRLEQARGEISKATLKSGTIRSRLKSVTELPTAESEQLLGSYDEADAEVLTVEDIYE